MRRPLIGFFGFALIIVRCADGGQPAFEGPGVALQVAPLSLPGVLKVCYDLIIDNGAGEHVVERGSLFARYPADEGALCSDVFGNGPGGDIAYVAPCDATPGTDHVTIYVDQLVGEGNVPFPADEWTDPCENGCQLSFECLENQDVAVVFNLTIMRRAHQGFFDVAVTFEDIFCSAKLDCSYDDAGNTPIELLFVPGTQARAQTAVIGFACTAGPNDNDETVLHMSDARVMCDPVDVFLGLSAVPATCDELGWVYGIAAGQDNVTTARILKGTMWSGSGNVTDVDYFAPVGAAAADGYFMRALVPNEGSNDTYAIAASVELDPDYVGTNPMRAVDHAWPTVVRRTADGPPPEWTVTQELTLPVGVTVSVADFLDPETGAFIGSNFFGHSERRNTVDAQYVVWLPDAGTPFAYQAGTLIEWPAGTDYCDISGIYDLHATGDCKMTGVDESRYYVWNFTTGQAKFLAPPTGAPNFSHYPPKLAGTIYALGSDVFLGTSEYIDTAGNTASIITTWRPSAAGFTGTALPGITLTSVPHDRLQLYADGMGVATIGIAGTSQSMMVLLRRDPPSGSNEVWRIWSDYSIGVKDISTWLPTTVVPGIGIAGAVAQSPDAIPVLAALPASGAPGMQVDPIVLTPLPYPVGTTDPTPDSVVLQTGVSDGGFALIGSARDGLVPGLNHALVWRFTAGGALDAWFDVESSDDIASAIYIGSVFGLEVPFRDARWAPVAPRCARLVGESIAVDGVSVTDRALTWGLTGTPTIPPAQGGAMGISVAEPDLPLPPGLAEVSGAYIPLKREIRTTTCDSTGRIFGIAAGEVASHDAIVEGRMWQWNAGSGQFDVTTIPSDGTHESAFVMWLLGEDGGFQYAVGLAHDTDSTYRGEESLDAIAGGQGTILRIAANGSVTHTDALVAPSGPPPDVMPETIDPVTKAIIGRGFTTVRQRQSDTWLFWSLAAAPATPFDYDPTGTLLATSSEQCELHEAWGGTVGGACLNGSGEARYYAWDLATPGTRMTLPLPGSPAGFLAWSSHIGQVYVVDVDHLVGTVSYVTTTNGYEAQLAVVWSRDAGVWSVAQLPYSGVSARVLFYRDGYAGVYVTTAANGEVITLFKRPTTFPGSWTSWTTLRVNNVNEPNWYPFGYLAQMGIVFGTYTPSGGSTGSRPFFATINGVELNGIDLPMPIAPTALYAFSGFTEMKSAFVTPTRQAVLGTTSLHRLGAPATDDVPYIVAWIFELQTGVPTLVDWKVLGARDGAFQFDKIQGLPGDHDSRWSALAPQCGKVLADGSYIEPGQQSASPRIETMAYAWSYDGSFGEQLRSVGGTQSTALLQVHLPETSMLTPPVFEHTLRVDQGRGNQWSEDPNLADNIFQMGVYYGNESLNCGAQSCNKRYFNIAIGFTAPIEENCYLYFDGTASSEGQGFQDGWPPVDAWYPRIDYGVQLTALGETVCRRNPLGGAGSGVMPAYSEPSLFSEPVRFCYAYDGATVTDYCDGSFTYYYDQPTE